jgi:hypothetical protein
MTNLFPLGDCDICMRSSLATIATVAQKQGLPPGHQGQQEIYFVSLLGVPCV